MFSLCVELFKKNKTSQRRDAESQRKAKEIKIVKDKRFSLLWFFLRVSASLRLCVRGLVFILLMINTLPTLFAPP
jgi:hypothetical protein